MKAKIESKAWDWANVPRNEWMAASDEFLPTALRWKQIKAKRILDLGCGRGRHALLLAKMGFHVTAIDLSSEGIIQLENEAHRLKLDKQIKTVVCDMKDLPFKPSTFDCVLCFHSVYHTDYKTLKKIISRIVEILKKKGRLYITLNSKDSDSYKKHVGSSKNIHTIIKADGFEKGVPHTFLNYKETVKLLSAFHIIKLNQIMGYRGNHKSAHFFIEAEKK